MSKPPLRFSELLEQHAIGNMYTGPSMSGPLFAGWPLTELAKVIPEHARAKAMVELVNKHHNHLSGVGVYDPGHSNWPMQPNHHQAGLQSVNISPISSATQATMRPSLHDMLNMRMRWGNPGRGTFANVGLHQHGDVVHIWLVTKDGQSVTLQDEVGLFPSDTLVTKLRMMQGE